MAVFMLRMEEVIGPFGHTHMVYTEVQTMDSLQKYNMFLWNTLEQFKWVNYIY